MGCSLDSLKGVVYIGDYQGLTDGDIRSLDYSSCGPHVLEPSPFCHVLLASAAYCLESIVPLK